MGLFNKRKDKKENIEWSNAYNATPKFYGKPDGSTFGAFALTEGADTVLPKNPKEEYKIDGKIVDEWKIVFVSTSKTGVIGEADYFSVLKKIEKFVVDSNKSSILVKGLSVKELESLI